MGSPFAYFIQRRDSAPDIENGPAQRNVRPVVDVTGDPDAPDGVRYGDTPSRPSQVQVYTAFHPSEYVAEDRFVVQTIAPPPYVATLAGKQQPWLERSNLVTPSYVAYGSLFTQQASRYT